ncbi:GNAT family N-acetyltransferase [Escherichia coli O157]|nr:GNAT family N-acetyltransferase [Escherichia coli O157]EKH6024467.1 GNAT family N-acetyltransferase [Escherichia coli O157]EKH6093903.1 GNAT family N-acetyltransferase [Escherichia coli O157]
MSIKSLVINERPFHCIIASTAADPHLYPHKQRIRELYRILDDAESEAWIDTFLPERIPSLKDEYASLELEDRLPAGAMLIVMIDAIASIPVGLLEVNTESHMGIHDVTSIIVKQEYRGRGIGHALMNEARNVAYHCGGHAIGLDVRADNAEAQAFYESEGFTVRSSWLTSSIKTKHKGA